MTAPKTNLLLEALSPQSRSAILSKCRQLDLPIRTSLQA